MEPLTIARLFENATERPVIYNGIPIVRVDFFPVKNGDILKVRFEGTNDHVRQGFLLKPQGTGNIVANGERLKVAVFWRDTAPMEFFISVMGKKCDKLSVRNVWDSGHGTMMWVGDSAIIVEEIPKGRRYRCNDSEPNDDFSDIIFTIERVVE